MANNAVDLVREVRNVAMKQAELFHLPPEGAYVSIEEVEVVYLSEQVKTAHEKVMEGLGYTAIREEKYTDGFYPFRVKYTR